MIQALLIDDDLELAEMLKEFLALEQITLSHSPNGQSGLEQLAQYPNRFHIILLDVMMPGLNGFEVLKRIRSDSFTPVLMLTAKGDETDKVLGLELGADDYLAKPYSPRELLARIHALVRRVQFEQQKQQPKQLQYQNLLLDLNQFQAYVNQVQLVLTATEFKILLELFQYPGQIHAKESLYRRVLEREMEPYDRSIDMHVSNLRKKLKHLKGPFEAIQTVRGVGYRVEVA